MNVNGYFGFTETKTNLDKKKPKKQKSLLIFDQLSQLKDCLYTTAFSPLAQAGLELLILSF